jgi:hypothetical protein
MAMELVAGMNVGDVDLDDGSLERLEGVINWDGRERVTGRIDDDGVRTLARGLDEIDDAPLVVRLLEYEGCADMLGERRAACLDSGKRGRAVDVPDYPGAYGCVMTAWGLGMVVTAAARS